MLALIVSNIALLVLMNIVVMNVKVGINYDSILVTFYQTIIVTNVQIIVKLAQLIL